MSELDWCAGFFDGEGYIGVNNHHKRRAPLLHVAIHQVSRIPLDRFMKAVGTGTVCGPYTYKSKFNNKPTFKYNAYGPKAVIVMALLEHRLCSVKQEQLRLARIKASHLNIVP